MIEKFGISFLLRKFTINSDFSVPKCVSVFWHTYCFCKKEPVFIEFKIFENRFFYLL